MSDSVKTKETNVYPSKWRKDCTSEVLPRFDERLIMAVELPSSEPGGCAVDCTSGVTDEAREALQADFPGAYHEMWTPEKDSKDGRTKGTRGSWRGLRDA